MFISRIYKISCGCCGKIYIGKTTKDLDKRLGDHISFSKSATAKSKLHTHIRELREKYGHAYDVKEKLKIKLLSEVTIDYDEIKKYKSVKSLRNIASIVEKNYIKKEKNAFNQRNRI